MKRQITYILIILVAITVLFGVKFVLTNDSEPIPLQEVLISDTIDLQERGLSGMNSLSDSTGMLFAFEKPDRYSFWMKDMNFPIDILWLDENFAVRDIEVGVAPQTYPKVFYPSSDALYVLEVNSGISQKNNYFVGKKLDFLKNFIK